MKLSELGKRLTKTSGIQELMEDMGQAMCTDEEVFMLGGGNPAHIPEINRIWRDRMEEILAAGDEFERMVANYDTPRGKGVFLDAVAEYFSETYGWNISARNVAVTNSSQTAFMMLLNMFAGTNRDGGRQKILFPLLPEYVGYADQVMEEGCMEAVPGLIDEISENRFKYRVNFDAVTLSPDTGAVCITRPTNPSGNVLTDDEVEHLSTLTQEAGIPLLVDNAYGLPFPHIIFVDARPLWMEHIVYSMSLSKLGLPSTRTGILIADSTIIDRLSACNAIVSLSCGTLGQVLTEPLVRSGEIARVSREIIMPYYRQKSEQARRWIDTAFRGRDYSIHVSEGALFLWLWLKDLSITTGELYSRLKEHNVLVIPGKYFFFGCDEIFKEHGEQCIRINYSQESETVKRGIELIADVSARYIRK